MSKNIENGKNFVTGCQNHKEEENNMAEKRCEFEETMSVNNSSLVEDHSGTIEEETAEEFWERMAAEPKPEWLRLWDEIEGYSKFRSLYEMEEQEPFFAILIRNEELKNSKSIRELKKMAAKYADECRAAERAAQEKTSKKVFEAIRRRWPDLSASHFERSMGMNEEEIKDFMKFVRESEWLQYIDQTAEEIEQMLMNHCSASVDSLISLAIDEYEKLLSLRTDPQL